MNNNFNNIKVAVVGGGLVGALEACLLAHRGFRVTLFEARHDGRNEPSYYGRSINLAISHRGISALKRLGLESVVDECAIPMKARMIHDKSGKSHPIPYDPDGRCINSIERAGLNNYLLNKAEQEFKVKILFNHKLVDMNSEKGELMFRLRDADCGEDVDVVLNDDGDCTNTATIVGNQQLLKYKFDIIFGCDGARSSVRSLLARQSELELQQTYIEHGYIELRIDPQSVSGAAAGAADDSSDDDHKFKMPANYLHIWPRGEYMMIALPNKDYSFTCTLFMPFKILNHLKDSQKAIEFFKKNFPDLIDLIGEQRIKDTLTSVKASSLISIKCKPYNYKDKVVLMGDSAHAMVPFYGQGMNCGFEDCLVLDEMLDKYLSDSFLSINHEQNKTTGKVNGTSDDNSSRNVSSSSNELVLIENNISSSSDSDKLFNISLAIGKALAEYNERRCPNGHSMCDLAMYNYIEMRDLVNTWSFLIRKQLDNLLYRLFPKKWIPLYTMVTFSRIPIHECIQRRQQQDKILKRLFNFGTITAGLSLTACLLFNLKRRGVL